MRHSKKDENQELSSVWRKAKSAKLDSRANRVCDQLTESNRDLRICMRYVCFSSLSICIYLSVKIRLRHFYVFCFWAKRRLEIDRRSWCRSVLWVYVNFSFGLRFLRLFVVTFQLNRVELNASCEYGSEWLEFHQCSLFLLHIIYMIERYDSDGSQELKEIDDIHIALNKLSK